MTKFEEEVKRPEIGIGQSSIKPALGKAVEFYTDKVKEYHNAFSDMTEISGKSLHEIYKEDARKYKESIAKERLYSESPTVTMPMEEFDKLEKLALSAHTDTLSVEKLQQQDLPVVPEDVSKLPSFDDMKGHL